MFDDVDKAMAKSDTKDDKTKQSGLPKPVFFIIGNEFCERFCFYGMKTVLIFYFTDVLLMNESEATQSFHEFTMACYFTPIIGALLADSFIGKFRTILYLSIIYAIGNIGLSYASFIEHNLISMISLGLIALGTGGIKPCVSAFGGDQFLPGQDALLKKFFAIFYLAINLGGLSSSLITPIFRGDVSCSVRGDCFPLAFGVPAVLMIVAITFLIVGKPLYRMIKAAKKNVLIQYIGCNLYGLKMKIKSLFCSVHEKKKHWLDWSKGKYDITLVNDVKRINHILFLFIPVPVFWALFDQQGSRWTLQAVRMNGHLFGNFVIKPDQIQVVNSLLIVVLIPLFEYLIYPLANRFNLLTKALQRMTLGGIFAALAFAIAAFLQLQIDSKSPIYSPSPLPNHAHLSLINGLPCDLKTGFNFENLTTLSFDSMKTLLNANILNDKLYLNVSSVKCPAKLIESLNKTKLIKLELTDQSQKGVFFYSNENYTFNYLHFDLVLSKWDSKKSFLKIVYNLPSLVLLENGIKLEHFDTVNNIELNNWSRTGFSDVIELEDGPYQLKMEGGKIRDIHFRLTKGSYLLVLNYDPSTSMIFHQLHELSEMKSVNVLWQIVQYTAITTGEIMFSITGLEFAYSQAPANMKSVLQATWLFTVSLGNLLVVFITKYIKFQKQSNEFFLFAGLMLLDMLVFAIMAYFYTYVETNPAQNDKSKSNESKGTCSSLSSSLPGSTKAVEDQNYFESKF